MQELGLELSMGERDDGSWAAAVFAFLMSRQNGKNDLAIARELFGLILAGEFIIHTAHLFKTSMESYDRLLELVMANEDVAARLVDKHRSVATGFDMTFRGGGRIVFLARGPGGSGRGFAGVDLLVFDEAQELTAKMIGDLRPTVSARPNSQVWYFGTAPDENAVIWQRQRHRGRRGLDARTAYVEVSADPDANLDDREAWRQANPALIYNRMAEETVEAERGDMTDDEFARERLSISPDIDDAWILPNWSAVCDPNVEVAEPAVFGLDANPERTAAAIVAAGPGPQLEVIDYRAGTGWLTDRVVELHTRYRRPFAIDRTGPAGAFIDELERKHVTVVAVDGPQLVQACGQFFDLVQRPETPLQVRSNPQLDAAVRAASKRPVGDAWAWGRKTAAADISLLVAATVAAWAVGQARRPRVYSMARLLEETDGNDR